MLHAGPKLGRRTLGIRHSVHLDSLTRPHLGPASELARRTLGIRLQATVPAARPTHHPLLQERPGNMKGKHLKHWCLAVTLSHMPIPTVPCISLMAGVTSSSFVS